MKTQSIAVRRQNPILAGLGWAALVSLALGAVAMCQGATVAQVVHNSDATRKFYVYVGFTTNVASTGSCYNSGGTSPGADFVLNANENYYLFLNFGPTDEIACVKKISASTVSWTWGGMASSYNPASNYCQADITVTNASTNSQIFASAPIPWAVIGSLTGAAALQAARAYVAGLTSGGLKKVAVRGARAFKITPASMAFEAAEMAGMYVCAQFFDSIGLGAISADAFSPSIAPTSDAECWHNAAISLNPAAVSDSAEGAKAAAAEAVEADTINTNSVEEVKTNAPSADGSDRGRQAAESVKNSLQNMGSAIVQGSMVLPSSESDVWNLRFAGVVFDCNPMHQPGVSELAAWIRRLFLWGLTGFISWAMFKECQDMIIGLGNVPQAKSAAVIPGASTGIAMTMAGLIVLAMGALPIAFIAFYNSHWTPLDFFHNPIADHGMSSAGAVAGVGLIDKIFPVGAMFLQLGWWGVWKWLEAAFYFVAVSIVKFCTG